MAKDVEIDEKPEDLLTKRAIKALGRTSPIRRLRSSHILSGFIGIVGIVLLFLGIEKLFGSLPGWLLIVLGLFILAVSGALFRALGR